MVLDVSGSSPHTRGALLGGSHGERANVDHPRIRGEHMASSTLDFPWPWIIPAYAGSTARRQDHIDGRLGSSPHTRGALSTVTWGTSMPEDHPRIRGEHRPLGLPRGDRAGIIPAYAGSTLLYVQMPGPHVGSSPHTRGARDARNAALAHARDHPRIRGEHT